MAYQRPKIKELKDRINEKRKFIQVIMGPRQVGKTTMVNQLLKSIGFPSYFVSADNVPNADNYWIEQQWEVSRLKWKQNETKAFLFVIDEIQKIDNWSETIKMLWDQDTLAEREIKVILLGSSRLLLQQGLTESLAGRFETMYLGHWQFIEMKNAFGWTEEQFVWFGGYPGSADLIADENRWKKYISDSLIETSISKDVLMLTRVDKPALLRRLFELGCLYSGQVLSYTKILGQLVDAGNTTTLSHYLNLLDTAGLLAGLEKYSGARIRQRSSSPKFQVHNTALISAQKNENFVQILESPKEWGRVVESAIGAHLINYALTEGFKVNYWRERGDEIDFVIEKKGKVIGLEIKSGSGQKAKGIEAFKKQMEPDKIILVGNSGLPWKEFLKINPNELF
ncbi:MAG: ATP-binding protein [Bacteroidetes bacterium]|nr:ATP-binding protein [Bacteroidota bacterium]